MRISLLSITFEVVSTYFRNCTSTCLSLVSNETGTSITTFSKSTLGHVVSFWDTNVVVSVPTVLRHFNAVSYTFFNRRVTACNQILHDGFTAK